MTNQEQQEANGLGRLRHSEANITIGSQRYAVSSLIRRGELLSDQFVTKSCVALCGIHSWDLLALLLAFLVNRQSCLLSSTDAQLPKVVSTSIGPQSLESNNAPSALSITSLPSPEIAAVPNCFAVLSSGTLGQPKVIWHDIASTVRTALLVQERLQLSAQSKVLITVPLHHMYGLGAALLPAIVADADITLLLNANLISLFQSLRSGNHDVVYSTPHQMRAVLKRLPDVGAKPSSLVMAGDAVSSELGQEAQRVFGRCFNLYGSSELGVVAISAANEVERLQPLKSVQLRSDAAHPALAQADLSANKLAATSSPCLWVRHPYAARGFHDQQGYHSMAEWWDTRDVGVVHHDGCCSLRGRVDLSVNRAGKLLVLAELEQQLMAWPEIDRAVASILPEQQAGGLTVALLVKASNDELDETKLRQLCVARLPYFARPDRYVISNDIPCLASGKPDRKTIMREYYNESKRDYPAVTATVG